MSEHLTSAEEARALAAVSLIRVEGGEVRLGPLPGPIAEELCEALRRMVAAGVNLVDIAQLDPSLAQAAVDAQKGLEGRAGHCEIEIAGARPGGELVPTYKPPHRTYRRQKTA